MPCLLKKAKWAQQIRDKMMDKIRLKILILMMMGVGLAGYAQSTEKVKADSTVTKGRLSEGVKLGEVEVTGERKFGIESAQMSAIEMSAQQIKQVPMVFGTPDVLKALQKLPGVNSEGEGSVGHSENYLLVRVPETGLHGQVKTIKITGVSGDELVGFPI